MAPVRIPRRGIAQLICARWRLTPYPAYINIDNIRFERYRRSQIGHGLRLST
ncbi:hypothetical protein YX13_002214 [Salmonella enterica subsp. enterica serovar Urbana]|nr:hypothetical protein [Salmonella enterica subsp. enterica serovar Urbana]